MTSTIICIFSTLLCRFLHQPIVTQNTWGMVVSGLGHADLRQHLTKKILALQGVESSLLYGTSHTEEALLCRHHV
jgi:hypothetical protein